MKGDDTVSPVKGQNVKDDPIKMLVHFRANEETIEQLNYVSDKTGVSKSEVIRKGIEIQYKKLKK